MSDRKAGRYQLLEELGRGAMGVVWKGFDPMIGRTVAVKTMRLAEQGAATPRPELVQRFQNETRAAGLLTHPNIVVVYDAGEDAGTFYITMEYIAGQSLQALIESKQAFPVPRVLRLFEQACAGLGYAHQHNVVHRDVKPANIMLTPDDTVKLTDFGMAKILQLGTMQTGQIVGTPSYMSPEQIKGKPVDGRADIFALGVVLYELLTGEKPFPGQNITTVIYKVVHEDPAPPRDLDPSIHPGLAYVVTRALHKDPEQRYQTCQDLLDDLRCYRDLGVREANRTVVIPGAARPAPAETRVPPGALRPASWPGREASWPPPPPAETSAPAAPAPASRELRAAGAFSSLPHLPVAPAASQPASRSYVWAGLLLLTLLAAGVYLLWPTLHLLVKGNASGATPSAAPLQPDSPAAPADKPAQAPEPERAARAAPPPVPRPARREPEALAFTPAAPGVAPLPPEWLRRIEQRLARAGLAGRVRAEIEGNTLTLTGRLTPLEHYRLLRVLRATPSRLRVQNRVEVVSRDTPPQEEKPRTAPGRGEVEVVTDVMGATAALRGPRPDQSWECKTPCRFEDLLPGRYAMEVTHADHRPIHRILQVQAGRIRQERLAFVPPAAALSIVSRPAEAEVWIDGQRTGVLTPATIRLPPGRHRVRVQKEGHEGIEQAVELGAGNVTSLNVELVEQPRGLGYLDVRSIPPGADILIDSASTGRRTPSRLQLPAGRYTVTLYRKGHQAVRRHVAVEAGQTLDINEILPR